MSALKTIAIIESCDTKGREAAYLRELVANEGYKPLVIDVSTGNAESTAYDISRELVLSQAGINWQEIKTLSKEEKIASMLHAIKIFTKKYYKLGKIQAVVSIGGLQNTLLATAAMKELPIGIPKVMATTVACGNKSFGPFVGDKDIVLIPSIADFTGLNLLTRQIMANAVAACVGMLRYAGKTLVKSEKQVIGITLMGITNTGACAAIAELEELGYECIGFHATGVGGITMEKLASAGLIDGILDLTVHEITQEYFKAGFSYGDEAKYRLRMSVECKIPLVIAPGGIDFIDFSPSEFPPRMKERKFMMHNPEMAHIKLLPDEAEPATKSFCERLEAIDYPVKVLLPTEGMRHNTRKGEELYDPSVDNIILKSIRAIKNPNLEIIEVPGNLDTCEWGKAAARFMDESMRQVKTKKE